MLFSSIPAISILTLHMVTQVRLVRPLGNHAGSLCSTAMAAKNTVPPPAALALPAVAAPSALPAPTALAADGQTGQMSRARGEQSFHMVDTARPVRDTRSAPLRSSPQKDAVRHRAR